MKIAVYAISKNEEKHVKRFCESAKEADLILIADTGSTDNTVILARECGAVVHNVFISPFKFDKARDAALALLPKDIDVCISMDLDEVLMPGWREEIERVWVGKTNRLEHSFDNSGGMIFRPSRVHARQGYGWKYPCHEYVVADIRTVVHQASTDFVLMRHEQDKTKSRSQYLDMLETAVKEDPNCSRMSFYYARELSYSQKFEETIAEFKRYLKLPTATWGMERGYAMRMIGDAYEALGQDATNWFYMAISEDLSAREPWICLANKYYKLNAWENCYLAAKKALSIKEQQLSHTTDPLSWGSLPHDLLAISAYRLGLKEEALKHGQIAVDLEPNNERLIKNLGYYKE